MIEAAARPSSNAVFLDGVRLGVVEAVNGRFVARGAAGARIGDFPTARAALHAVHDHARRARLAEALA